MRALTIGGATVDIIGSVDDRNLERMSMENADTSFLLLEEGTKVEAKSINFYIGGGATNAAVSMARRGFDVACLVKIGKDQEGQMVRDRLIEENVDTRPVLIDEATPTGRAIMIASHAKNPTIFVARGANTTLLESEINPDIFKGKELVYVTGLSGDSADCFERIVTLAKDAGAMVACNPGIRQLVSRSRAFYDMLKHIDLLTLNKVETEQLVPELSVKAKDGTTCDLASYPLDKKPRLLCNPLENKGFKISLPDLFRALSARGVKRFLLTDGKDGAYLMEESGLYFCPSLDAQVKGTAGAGDSFASTCVSELAKGQTAEIALKKATLNAASVVSCVDAQSGLCDDVILDAQLEKTDWTGFHKFSW